MNRTATASTTATKPSADSETSLRAAALSTLRLKRRKHVERPVSNSSRPPPPSDALQLDYGAEDTPQDVSMKDVLTPPLVASETEKSRSSVDQQLAREEGEISEGDEPLLPSKFLPVNSRSSSRRKVFLSPEPLTSEPMPPTRLNQGSLIQPLSEMDLSYPDRLVGHSHQFSARTPSPDVRMQDTVHLESHSNLLSVGPNCVRPGLPCE
jgi:hypothetical protein